MKKLSRIAVCIGLGLLIIFGVNLQGITQPAQSRANQNVTMNSAESELITTIKTACKALALQSDNPAAIANQFGKVIDVSLKNSQTVKPFNPNYQKIRIGTRGSLPAPPYPAYLVEISIAPKVPLTIQALQQVLGEYRKYPRIHYNTPRLIVFRPIFPELPDYTCTIGVSYRNGEKNIADATIVEVNVQVDKSSSEK
jgi:hypothetical protein